LALLLVVLSVGSTYQAVTYINIDDTIGW